MNTRLKFVVCVLPIIGIMLLLTPAKALTVTISVTPQNILPGESVTIFVFSDETGMGAVFVKDSLGGTHAYKGNPMSFPGTFNLKYPNDFTSGSTTMLGEYKVIVLMGGSTFLGFFFVKFFVIPESMFGTLLGVLAPTLAFLGMRTRIYKRHKG